jgi:UDPglucose 6-dehydrogenase
MKITVIGPGYGGLVSGSQIAKAANNTQKDVRYSKASARFGNDLTNKHFGLCGLAVKPDSDDMRETPSQTSLADLMAAGALAATYDPMAMKEPSRMFGDEPRLQCTDKVTESLVGSDPLLTVTEWKEFRSADLYGIKRSLKSRVKINCRSRYDPKFARRQEPIYAAELR